MLHWAIQKYERVLDTQCRRTMLVKNNKFSQRLLLSFGLVVWREFIEEFAVDFHERLKNVVDERHDRLVPVFFRDPVESGKHDGQDDGRVLFNQTHDVLIVPVVQSPLGHLQQQWHDTFRVPTTLLTLNSITFPELSRTNEIFFQTVFVMQQHINLQRNSTC